MAPVAGPSLRLPRSSDLSHYLARRSSASFHQLGSAFVAASDSLIKRSNIPRDDESHKPPVTGQGAVPPNAIDMKGIQALFALIGASFVIGAIWFFFWAKNGGFKWRKGDWEDYKSTVLRRKGPDGKTLSNATKSTRLGGGSVVASGYSDDDGTIMTGLSSEAAIIKEKQGRGAKGKAGKKNNLKSKEKGGDGKAKRGLRGGGGHGMEKKKPNKRAEIERQQKEARWEGGFDDDMRAYRHEKSAKVGGLNRGSDSQYYGTEHTHSASAPSLDGGFQPPPPPPRHSRQSSPEKTPRRSHRDFSYTHNAHEGTFVPTSSPSPTRPSGGNNNNNRNRYHSPNKPPSTPSSAYPSYYNNRDRQSASNSYTDPLDFDAQSQNTKSYHHPIPGLSRNSGGHGGYGGGAGNRMGRGANGGGLGGRRGAGRRDSLDDSE